MGDMFKLYIIYSNLGLQDLLEKICIYASSPGDVSSVRKDFTRSRKNGSYSKSNRRFIILHNRVFDGLKKSGYNTEGKKDFYICEYEIRENNVSPSDCVMHYYFPDYENTKLDMISKMEHMANMGLFETSDYVIHNGVVEFSPNVPNYNRTIVKVVIDTIDCRVSWCRNKAFASIKRSFTD